MTVSGVHRWGEHLVGMAGRGSRFLTELLGIRKLPFGLLFTAILWVLVKNIRLFKKSNGIID